MKSLTLLPSIPSSSTFSRTPSKTLPTFQITLKPVTYTSREKASFYLKSDRIIQQNPIREAQMPQNKIPAKLAELKHLDKTRQGNFGPCSKTLHDELTERIIKKAESILEQLNIRLNLIGAPKESSRQIVAIQPLTLRYELSNILLIMVPEICTMPASFLEKLDLKTLSFCDEVVLHRGNFPLKTSGQIFEVTKCDTSKKTIQALYRLVSQHLLKKMPELRRSWQEFLLKFEGAKATDNSWSDDLAETLAVLNKPKGVQSSSRDDFLRSLKVSELKNKLDDFDSHIYSRRTTGSGEIVAKPLRTKKLVASLNVL